MKKVIFLSCLLAAFIVVSCEKTDIPDAEKPHASLELRLGGISVQGTETFEINRGESQVFSYYATGISKITSECPSGWACAVFRSSETIEISAPEYSNTEAPAEGDILLNIYDGSGGAPGKTSIHVKAVEKDMEFTVEEVEQPVIFSIGSQRTFTYTKSASVGDLSFELPAGWTAEVKDDNIFILTAPDLSITEGDASGVVTVTPVSWSGNRNTSLAERISVIVSNESTFQFEDKEVSFNYGETKILKVIAKGLKSFSDPQMPKGWSGDFSNILNGTVSITAPAKDADMVGRDSLIVTAMSFLKEPVTSSAVNIRLYGINDYDELLSFRDAYGATSNTPVTEGLDKYLVNKEITLNSDIDIPESGMASVKAYFIKYLVMPLNGSGHTLTIHFKSSFGVGAIFQYIKGVKVSDLNIAGVIENNSNASGQFATLATKALDGSSFENVNCSTEMWFNPNNIKGYQTSVGGLVSELIGNVSFKKCNFSGKIIMDAPVLNFGGITAKTDASKPGFINTFEDCEFSGEIIYTQSADNMFNTRGGGIAGDMARQGEFDRCKFTGKITMNMHGNIFFTTNMAKGIGGVVGRITSPASGYTMKATLEGCVSSGSITINGLKSGEPRNCTNLVIGCKPGTSSSILTETDSVVTGTLTFN